MKKKQLLGLVLIAMEMAVFGGEMDVSAAQGLYPLNEITVYGSHYYIDADSARTAPVADGLIGTKQDVGILGKKEVLETPFQQVTFTKKAIETFSQPQRSLMDTLSLSPSVRVTHGSTDTNIYIRGYSAGSSSWIMNGIPDMSHQMVMPANYLDKAEVISGPNIGINGVGVFMGGSVGGTVSVTTKKAQNIPNMNVGLSWSSASYYTQTFDIGKRFGENNEWGIRINALNSTGNLAVHGTRDYKRDIAINIDHKAKRSTTNIFFSYDYDNQYGRSNTIGLGKLTALPKVPNNKRNLSPHWSNDKYENTTFILNHEQYLSDHLTWFANFGWRWEDYSSWLQQWSSRQLQDFDGNYTGTYTQMPVFHHYTYVNTGFKGQFNLGEWKNEWVALVDWTKFKRNRDNNVTAANKYSVSGNIYDGSYTSTPDVVWDPITNHYRTIMRGWTLADTISSPNQKMHFTFGYHGHTVETRNYVSESYMKSEATAPIIGLSYKITPRLAVYASHTENFIEGTEVGSQYTNAGSILPPSKTKQNEFGFKFKNGNTLSTLSFFEIQKANGISVPNADDSRDTYKLDGKQKNKGVEYAIAGDFGDKWSYIWSASYLNSKQIKTQNGLNDGRRVDAMPKWMTDIALIYRPNDKLSMIGRLGYTGDSLIRNTSSYDHPLKIGGQTLIDLGMSWDTHFGKQPVTLSVWCYNLLNKDYWYAADSNSIGLGAPRTYSVSAQFKF